MMGLSSLFAGKHNSYKMYYILISGAILANGHGGRDTHIQLKKMFRQKNCNIMSSNQSNAII